MALRWGLLSCCVLVLIWNVTAAHAQAPRSIDDWIAALSADEHAARENAVVELTLAGPPAVEALLQAAISRNPELAWRAEEALELMCRSTNLETEAALHGAIVTASRGGDAALVARAKDLLAKWPRYRHEYAAAQLELRGARVGDIGAMAYPSGEGVPIAVPFGGGFFGGLIVPEDDGDLIDVDAALDEPAIRVALADFGIDVAAVAEDVPVAVEAEAEVAEEEAADEPAEEAPRGKAPGGIFGAIGRALGGVRAAEDAGAEIIADMVEERMAEELERFEKIEAAGADDVEFLEEPAAGPVMAEEDIAVELVELADEGVWATGESYDPSITPPHTLILDQNYNGGDDGLRFAPHLQNIYHVKLHQAAVTSAALTHLAKMKQLNQLEVSGTAITGAALQQFKRSRPQVNVSALGPAVIGITGQDHPRGVLVQNVFSETGARRAGMLEGDIVTHVEGRPVKSFSELTLAIYDKRPGDKLELAYLRGGSKREAMLELTAREDLPPPTVPAGYGGDVQYFAPGPEFHQRFMPAMELIDR